MSRRNPPAELAISAIAPLLPYVILAGIVYFYGKDIWAAIGSKITGVSTEKIKAGASTVAEAVSSPVETTSDIIKAVTAKYISPAEQAKAIADIKKTLTTAAIKLPFPVPKSTAEFRANIEAIALAKGFKK